VGRTENILEISDLSTVQLSEWSQIFPHKLTVAQLANEPHLFWDKALYNLVLQI